MTRTGMAASLALVTASVLAPGVARAAECKVDSDCPKGWRCDVARGEECAAPDCADDDPDCSREVVCESVTDYQCVPDDCSDDSDCADGMACYEIEDDDAALEAACLPSWLLPCVKDSDCGAGFNCVAPEVCQCVTSRPTAAAGASSAPAEEPDCTCEKSDETQCQAIEEKRNCDADSDCPSSWTCEQVTIEDDVCSASAEGTSGEAGGAASQPAVDDDDDDTSSGDCGITTTTEKLCAPPYWDLARSSSAGSKDDGSLSGGDDDDDAATESGGDDDDAATEPGADDDDTASGAGAASDDDDDTARGSSAEQSDEGCGCRVRSGRTPSALWLGVFGLIGLGLRRRRNL